MSKPIDTQPIKRQLEKYMANGLNHKEIGKFYNCSGSTICIYCKKLGARNPNLIDVKDDIGKIHRIRNFTGYQWDTCMALRCVKWSQQTPYWLVYCCKCKNLKRMQAGHILTHNKCRCQRFDDDFPRINVKNNKGTISNIQDLRGYTWATSTVLKFDEVRNKYDYYWHIKCNACQKIYSKKGSDILTGGKCKCQKIEYYKSKSHKQISQTFLNKIHRNADFRGIDRSTLTMQDLQEQLDLQDGKCYYCGENLVVGMTLKELDQGNASIDRINNSIRSYRADNIVFSCKICNMAKHIHTAKDYIQKCLEVAKHNYSKMFKKEYL